MASRLGAMSLIAAGVVFFANRRSQLLQKNPRVGISVGLVVVLYLIDISLQREFRLLMRTNPLHIELSRGG